MKKTFLAGFMAFCVIAMSMSAVSCTKEIEQEIADLKEEVADIQAKLAELQAKLTQDVKTLNEVIAAAKTAAETNDAALKAELEGKIAVIGYEENNDGTITITFANGDEVVVSAPVENASNTGLVTTVEVDGKLYWATVNADGTKTSLGVEVGHPTDSIDFKVDPESKELLVSINSGEYEGTGVFVKDPDTYDHTIVTAVENDDDTITLTIGDASFTLPKYVEDTASLVLGRTDFFLRYGATKEVSLTAEGIAEYYVMSKPDGWKASIDGTVLTVTAPLKKAAEVGAAEEQGEILIHATSNQGKCKVAKLVVSTGLGLSIQLDGNMLTLTNSYTGVDEFEGVIYGYYFANFRIGIVPSSALEGTTLEEYVNEPNDNYGEFITPGGCYGGWDYNYNIEHIEYIEGECEVESYEITVEDVYKWIGWEDEDKMMTYGEEYIVWVAPEDPTNGKYVASEVQYVKYTPILNEVEITDITFNDATLNLNLAGATAFYTNFVSADYIRDAGLEGYLSEGNIWMFLTQAMPQYIEYVDKVVPDGDYTGENAITFSSLFGGPLQFDTEYYVWVFPYVEGTVYTDFETQFMPYVYNFKTAALAAGGGSATLELAEATFESVSVNVTPGADTETMYYQFYTADEFNAFADEAAIMTDVTKNGYEINRTPVTYDYLEPGESTVLAVVTVSADGKYGIAHDTFTAKELPTEVNAELKAEYGEPTIDYSSIKVALTAAEGTTVFYKYMSDTALGQYTSDADLAESVITGGKSTTTSTTATENYLSAGDSRTLVVVVVDADNKYNVDKSHKYTTKTYPNSDEITIKVTEMTFDAEAMTCKVKFAVTGNVDKIMAQKGYENGLNNFISNVMKYAPTENTYYNTYKFIEVGEDGTAEYTFTNVYDWDWIYATVYVVTDGAVSAIAKEAVATSVVE